MKCPHCGKGINPGRKACPHCGVRFVRKSDKLARKMTSNAKFAIASGGALAFMAVILAIYGMYEVGIISLLLGLALVVIGKLMD